MKILNNLVVATVLLLSTGPAAANELGDRYVNALKPEVRAKMKAECKRIFAEHSDFARDQCLVALAVILLAPPAEKAKWDPVCTAESKKEKREIDRIDAYQSCIRRLSGANSL